MDPYKIKLPCISVWVLYCQVIASLSTIQSPLITYRARQLQLNGMRLNYNVYKHHTCMHNAFHTNITCCHKTTYVH